MLRFLVNVISTAIGMVIVIIPVNAWIKHWTIRENNRVLKGIRADRAAHNTLIEKLDRHNKLKEAELFDIGRLRKEVIEMAEAIARGENINV